MRTRRLRAIEKVDTRPEPSLWISAYSGLLRSNLVMGPCLPSLRNEGLGAEFLRQREDDFHNKYHRGTEVLDG